MFASSIHSLENNFRGRNKKERRIEQAITTQRNRIFLLGTMQALSHLILTIKQKHQPETDERERKSLHLLMRIQVVKSTVRNKKKL